MPRPVTLITGQWTDLPLEVMASLASRKGFDGLELACWGDNNEDARATSEPAYCRSILVSVGGDFTITSEVGVGTRVAVRLRAASSGAL